MNGHLKKITLLIAMLLTTACAQTLESDTFANLDYSGGSPKYGVYVSSQGRSIISGLSF